MPKIIIKKWPIVVVIVIFISLLGIFLWKSNIKETTMSWDNHDDLKLTDEGKKTYEESMAKLEDRGDDSGVLTDLAHLRDRGGDPQGSIQLYKKALESDPDNTLALFNLAEVYKSVGNYQEAAEMYSKVIEYHPLEVSAYRRLFDLVREKLPQRYNDKEILETILRGWQVNADRPEGFMEMAAIYYEDKGDLSTAKKYYDELLQYNPNNEVAQEGIKRLK